MRKLYRGPSGQRVGHATGRAGRRTFGRLLEAALPGGEQGSLDDVRDVERVLLVRPNFRIGNTLMTNALIPGLRERFPGARLEVLAGDTTLALLEQMPIDAVHPMSRSYVKRPWEFAALFRRLRHERFDVAIEAGMGSFSGGLYSYLSGARWRVGVEGAGERFLNVRLPRPVCSHAYDDAVALGASLGMSASDRPLYAVGEGEREAALRVLSDLDLRDGERIRSFVSVFVGGHLHKRWPNEKWLAFVRALDAAGVPFVVLLGPEETGAAAAFQAARGQHGRVLPPQSLRVFAAFLAESAVLATPDSGPMHLGVALGVPTVAFLNGEASRFYAPRGEEDRAIVSPSVDQAVGLVVSHPRLARRAS